MNIETVLRFVGAGVGIVLGYIGGLLLFAARPIEEQQAYAVLLALLAGVALLLGIPLVTTMPFRALLRRLQALSAGDIVAGGAGLLLGLAAAALLTLPLRELPIVGSYAPTVAGFIFAYVGAWLAMLRKREIAGYLGGVRTLRPATTIADNPLPNDEPASSPAPVFSERGVLVDTSAIIDGRIADIAQTGFVEGTLLVPRFVLNELQHIADNADSLRRARGRRGLEILNRMQKDSAINIQISDLDADNTPEVDSKLIKIARQHRYAILTNDYNLNKVADLQGVKVLNINALANALKPNMLPGELLDVHIIQDGKEMGQGVGYLDDGTMVVVENGRQFMNKTITVLVTRVLQTAQGRMIFAQVRD